MRRYLEPRTDVPAAEDWSTALILAESRAAGRVGRAALAVLVPAGLGTALFLPGAAGNVVAAALLGLLALICAVASLVSRADRRMTRRGLLCGPWRRRPATVAAPPERASAFERLIVFDDSGTLVVRGVLTDALGLVLDRQEVFLVGPDEAGRVVLRAPGLCQLFRARVDDAEARPREREPRSSERPLDDTAVAQAFDVFRWGTRAWLWPAVPTALGAALVLLSIAPLAIAGLVAGGLLLVCGALAAPMLVLGPWYRQAVAGLRSASRWTQAPFTLFPWEPGRAVAGLAQLPGGLALVQFPLPNPDVIANIADTGVLWTAGTPSGGAVAAGVPGVPALTLGVVQPDRDTPEERTQPWLMRANEPSLRTIPVLNR
ncbi:hypothetical protein [Actinokineospora pegani]|uniref:hypothetical protein n=1 Tax=Actinokineospora pegani TaxID=2654637 RepID=UPI0012EA8B32|nr:hypothetical protein [Actinokineospora pegani]